MSDTAPDPWDQEPEFVWAANENTDILPARMNKAALNPDLEEGPASKGWYQVDAGEAARLDAEQLAAQGAVTEAAAEPEAPASAAEPESAVSEPTAADFAPGK